MNPLPKLVNVILPNLVISILPSSLIDEFKFSTRFSKYCCHLVDFEASESVDVIRSRQKAYLDEYFGRIGESERGRVKVLDRKSVV